MFIQKLEEYVSRVKGFFAFGGLKEYSVLESHPSFDSLHIVSKQCLVGGNHGLKALRAAIKRAFSYYIMTFSLIFDAPSPL